MYNDRYIIQSNSIILYPLNSLTGEEADRLSGLSRPQDDMMALSESVYQSREHISNVLER